MRNLSGDAQTPHSSRAGDIGRRCRAERPSSPILARGFGSGARRTGGQGRQRRSLATVRADTDLSSPVSRRWAPFAQVMGPSPRSRRQVRVSSYCPAGRDGAPSTPCATIRSRCGTLTTPISIRWLRNWRRPRLIFEELLPYVIDATRETPGAGRTVRGWWARHLTRAVPQVRAGRSRRSGRVAIARRLVAPATGSRTS